MYVSLADSRAKGFKKWATFTSPKSSVVLAPERPRVASFAAPDLT
jgi:hypothetical protein